VEVAFLGIYPCETKEIATTPNKIGSRTNQSRKARDVDTQQQEEQITVNKKLEYVDNCIDPKEHSELQPWRD
jgi:hypothetical protein